MMMCLDCGQLSPNPRCPEHEGKYERAKWKRKANRYDYNHKMTRQALAPLVATGKMMCSRYKQVDTCTGLITITDTWCLDHIYAEDGSYTYNVSHARCNSKAIRR